MEPNTASRLKVSLYQSKACCMVFYASFKERNRNKLKDYLTMAPALQVTHLLAFTLTPIAPSLRIVRLSNGPTLSFRVERYSLIKDVLNTSKRTRSIGMEYLSPPLVRLFSLQPHSKLKLPTACPRIIPTSLSHNPSAYPTTHESVPIPLPSTLTEIINAIDCPPSSSRLLQRGTRHRRMAALHHHGESLRRIQTYSQGPGGHI